MPADVVTFGNDLELDRRAYELRRSGRPLKLERIPMELLLLLVERKGQLVTREEIISRLWGKDVFLNTDNSIGTRFPCLSGNSSSLLRICPSRLNNSSIRRTVSRGNAG